MPGMLLVGKVQRMKISRMVTGIATALAVVTASLIGPSAALATPPEAAMSSTIGHELAQANMSSGHGPRGPHVTAPDVSGAHLVAKRHLHGNRWEIDVYSPAMGTTITSMALIAPGHAPRPTFYLLSGSEGGQAGQNWAINSNYEQFFADKHVNVITPLGGQRSFYSDWENVDPALGNYKWTTFIAYELPSVIDREFHGNGRDAVGGISASGSGAMDLAAHNPGRFKAAASYSGCPSTGGAFGWAYASVITGTAGGSSHNAWGLPDSPNWNAHNPVRNLDRLRNTALFVSSSHGIPSARERDLQPIWIGPRLVELGSHACSEYFTTHARNAGLHVTRYTPTHGAHSFFLFEESMRESWKVIGPAIGT